MNGLLWKFNRLRAMGIQEIVYRISHAAQAQWERRGLALARPVEPAGSLGRAWLSDLPQVFDVAVYGMAADQILAGRFDVFAMKDAPLGFPPDWNRDPKTGAVAPLVFGKTLNYRDERIVGDIKYLWEPNRHAELVTLAQAWHLTRDEKYAEGCRTLLASWFEQCPYPLGVNWTSSLEHSVRLVNWAVAWFLLDKAELDSEFKQRWLDSIYQHCHFIAGHFSRHSSANNHLLGELMGLFIGATVWPLWPESKVWRARSAREFETEALKQNGADGVNREQAIWYQHEVADMMLLVGLFGRANDIEFSDAYWERLKLMLEFVSATMDSGGRVPMIGDADDAMLVRFAPVDVYRSLLATGAVLYGRADFKGKAGAFDDKSHWLLGEAGLSKWNALPAAPAEQPRRAFPEGGYWILGDRFSTEEEVRLVVDAGPLGYLSIAAHGHADALSLVLSVGGVPFLIDPGTYAYHTQKKWRDYFRGTSAHNTVRVDGQDQSVIGGNFLWLQKAEAQCECWETNATRDRFVGSHDGYRRLADKLVHRREIVFDKVARQVTVVDTLECKARHMIELFWHFAPSCEVHFEGETVHAAAAGHHLSMVFSGHPCSASLVCGDDDLPLGWHSQSFDEREPTNVLRRVATIDRTAIFVTRILIETCKKGSL